VAVPPLAYNFPEFLLPRPECATFDPGMLCGTALARNWESGWSNWQQSISQNTRKGQIGIARMSKPEFLGQTR
jgi:hypothetical protein